MKEAALLDLFERREHARGTEIEGMVVRQRQRLEADTLQSVEHDRIAAAEERALERPAAVTSKDRAFEVGEGEIGFAQQRANLGECRSGDVADVMFDQRLAGNGEGEAVLHGRTFWGDTRQPFRISDGSGLDPLAEGRRTPQHVKRSGRAAISVRV